MMWRLGRVATVVLAALLSSCAGSSVVRVQKLVMVPARQPDAATAPVMDPYKGIPFRVEARCDEKLSTFMMSPLIPLPPVIPAGIFGPGDDKTYITVTLGKDVQYEPLQASLAFREGINKPVPVQLFQDDGTAPQLIKELPRDSLPDGSEVVTYKFDVQCTDLNNGSLLIAPVIYQGQKHASVTMLLKFSYTTRTEAGYMQ